jgi:nucleoside-diphosphate-sugar epimerase
MNEKTSMRILVLGGAGYIGHAVVKAFRGSGFECQSADRLHDGSSLEDIQLELRDARGTAECIGAFHPDVVVHCGTHSALRYQNDFLEAFEEDTIATTSILRALRSYPQARFVYFSSSYCYSGMNSEETFTEEVCLSPSHHFGLSKLFFEQMFLRHHPNTVVLRLGSVFGEGNARHPNSIVHMAHESLRTRRIDVWGMGRRRMQFIDIDSVVRYVFQSWRIPPGTYNVGGDEHITMAEAARSIAEALGAEVEFSSNKAEGESLPFMSIEKIKRASGIAPLSFHVALSQYLQILRSEA